MSNTTIRKSTRARTAKIEFPGETRPEVPTTLASRFIHKQVKQPSATRVAVASADVPISREIRPAPPSVSSANTLSAHNLNEKDTIVSSDATEGGTETSVTSESAQIDQKIQKLNGEDGATPKGENETQNGTSTDHGKISPQLPPALPVPQLKSISSTPSVSITVKQNGPTATLNFSNLRSRPGLTPARPPGRLTHSSSSFIQPEPKVCPFVRLFFQFLRKSSMRMQFFC